MKLDSLEYRRNMALAKEIAEPDRTVAVLMDRRPGFSEDSARQVICAMMEMGYLVHEITVDELCQKDITGLGAVLVLPHAESVPAVCARPIEEFWKQGGRVLILGGLLFAHLIEKEGDAFSKTPLREGVLDAATSGDMYPVVMEGVTPYYKIYEVDHVRRFMTEKTQCLVERELVPQDAENIVCSCPRPHGFGYGMDRRNRYIPLLQAVKEGGRAEGMRGAPVSIMLSDVQMKRKGVDGNRFGYVMGTTRGASVGMIGLKRQDILSVYGMRSVLEELLGVLQRGLFLFEAGSSCFVAKKGETVRLGARVMNQRQEYLRVQAEFLVSKGNEIVFRYSKEELALPGNMTNITTDYNVPSYGEYTVETLLKHNGRIIDRIKHALNVPAPRKAGPDEFVRVENGNFMLGDAPWYAFGINYWPLYYPGFERDDYWMGWLDKANYDPLEVERDLAFMEQMGLNCLFTRVDGNVLERSIDSLKDFMLRCENHGMKLSLSYCNITSPLHYQPEAFRRFMNDADLYENPVLFSHDLAWEVGGKYFQPHFMNTWNTDWRQWILDRYGSMENAEADWGVPADRLADGRVVAPPPEQFNTKGAWHVKICAYRRFLDDFISRKWNDTVTDMRKADPVHLIAYRMGSIGDNTTAFSATGKHIDFASPEAYRTPNEECGKYYAATVPLLFALTTRGKPVVWSEYGMSLTDVNWRQLVWDNENLRPFDRMAENQIAFLKRVYQSFSAANVCGSAPWWFPGGIRRVEMSDFGFCAPDGTLRPGGEAYAEMGKWFKQPREKREADDVVTLDPDEYIGGWAEILRGGYQEGDENKPLDGNANRLYGEVRGAAPRAVQKADLEGKAIAFRTPGTGTDSANMPFLAVGNVPLTGHNPPKYLDAEFNCIEGIVNGNQPVQLKNGEALRGKNVRLRANIGNIQEATWLKPAQGLKGGVFLTIEGAQRLKAPILADTPYLSDAQTDWIELTEPGEYILRMEAENCSAFGEVWRIRVEE